MKTKIVERWSTYHPERKEKFEYHENVLWQGEPNCVYLQPQDINIAQPTHISIENDKVEIVYGEPHSNVKIKEDNQPTIGRLYLWCEPAIDAESLEKLKSKRKDGEKSRQSNLKTLKA